MTHTLTLVLCDHFGKSVFQTHALFNIAADGTLSNKEEIRIPCTETVTIEKFYLMDAKGIVLYEGYTSPNMNVYREAAIVFVPEAIKGTFS